jgi:hypothetical protein
MVRISAICPMLMAAGIHASARPAFARNVPVNWK